MTNAEQPITRSELLHYATKTDFADLKAEIAELRSGLRSIRWGLVLIWIWLSVLMVAMRLV